MSRYIRSLIVVGLSLAALSVAMGVVLAATHAGPGTAIVIANTPGDSTDPVVAYGSGITYAVWSEAGWIVYSKNSGLSWAAPISITEGDEPALAVDHNGVPQLAFTELLSSTVNVYHTRYVGNAWTAPLRLSNGTDNTSSPDIAVAPNNTLRVVWSQQQPLTTTKQIEIAESTNGGSSWPSLGPILDAHGSSPKVAIGADGLTHVIWQDDTSTPFHLNHVQRLSGAWSIAAILSDATAPALAPDLITAGNQVHAVWEQSQAIQYTQGADLSFSAPLTISTGAAKAPSIAATAVGSIVAAWKSDPDTSIALRVKDSTGWGSTQSFGSNPSGVGHVSLSAGPTDYTYAVFTWGASGSRDIAFNYLATTSFRVHLPLIVR
jgi:hypothetical protein